MVINKENLKLEEELQRTKEDLEDLEKYIEEFSTFLPLAICTLNPIGVIIDVNQVFEKLSGFNSLEIISKTFDTLFLERRKVKRMIREIVKKRKIEGEELTFLTKSKRKISVSVSLGLRRDKEGTFIGSFAGIFDISELKKLQERLEEKVKERTKELQARIEELEKFHRLTVGREMRMIELNEENKRLKAELEKLRSSQFPEKSERENF